jgi:hypothetical protein
LSEAEKSRKAVGTALIKKSEHFSWGHTSLWRWPARLQSWKSYSERGRMKSYPQASEVLGVVSQPHRLTQRKGQKSGECRPGRRCEGQLSPWYLHSLAGRAAAGFGREPTQSCFPQDTGYLGLLLWEFGGVPRSRLSECSPAGAYKQLSLACKVSGQRGAGSFFIQAKVEANAVGAVA